MAQTKFTASVSLTVAHPDGTKITKTELRQHVKDQLERYDDQLDRLLIAKATVRDVDLD